MLFLTETQKTVPAHFDERCLRISLEDQLWVEYMGHDHEARVGRQDFAS